MTSRMLCRSANVMAADERAVNVHIVRRLRPHPGTKTVAPARASPASAAPGLQPDPAAPAAADTAPALELLRSDYLPLRLGMYEAVFQRIAPAECRQRLGDSSSEVQGVFFAFPFAVFEAPQLILLLHRSLSIVSNLECISCNRVACNKPSRKLQRAGCSA